MGNLVEGQPIAGLSGSYTVERALPKSGFGQAFVGRDGQGTRVLLKEVHVAESDAWKRVDALQREADATAHLKHSHIARFIEIFAFDGERATPAKELSRPTDADGVQSESPTKAPSLVLVRSFVEGTTLAESIVKKRRFNAAELETIFRGLLEARVYLDTLLPTVIHGDASPNNVVIDEKGGPWLIDFGAVADEVQGSPSAAVGTSGFMPPEQLAGRATPASDLYAIAMTVLSAASHRAAHDMPIDARTMRIPVARVVSGLEKRMVKTLDACLEPSLHKRVRSAREALLMLDGSSKTIARARGLLESRAPQLRKPLWIGLAATVYALPALLVALPLWARSKHHEPQPTPYFFQAPPVTYVINPPSPATTAEPPDPVAPAVDPTPVPPVSHSIQWVGSVEHAMTGLSSGDSCVLTLDVTNPNDVNQCNVTLSCKDRVVVSDLTATQCTMNEIYSPTGQLVYRAALTVDHANGEIGSEVALDYKTGLIRATTFDAAGAKTDEVVAKLTPRSLPRIGDTVLAEQRFEKALTIKGTAVRVDGAAHIKKGESCTYTLKPNSSDDVTDGNNQNCNAIVQCGSTVLYDGHGTCQVSRDGSPWGFADASTTAGDGDPTVDLTGQVLSVSDSTARGRLDVVVYLDQEIKARDNDE